MVLYWLHTGGRMATVLDDENAGWAI
jgi:hypothetical protein